MAIKFYLKNHWGVGKAALGFGSDWIRTLVSMATDRSHMSYNGENVVHTLAPSFLAHLSRRLKDELIVYQSSCHLAVCLCVSVNIFKLEYLRNQWANRNEILSEPSLG